MFCRMDHLVENFQGSEIGGTAPSCLVSQSSICAPNGPEPKMVWWEGTAEIPGRIVGNTETIRRSGK